MTVDTTLRTLATAAVIAIAAPAAATKWKVDPARSRIGFSGTQTGEMFQGQFGVVLATIDFDPANPEAGRALIDIDLATAKTGDSQRDEALPGEDWFDIARFPKARFEAKRFTSKGANAYEVTGTLCLRGVCRDLVLPFKLEIKEGTAHVTGHLDVMRTAFGVGQHEWSSDEYVGFAVGIDIDLTATPDP